MATDRILRILTTLCLLAALAGCAEREAAADLRIERDRLQALLDDQAAKRQAEIVYLERQAGIAAACDWIVPLCPASVVATGRQAQAGGFGGGGSVAFWLVFLAKLAAAGVSIAMTFSLTHWLWSSINAPRRREIEQARQTIEEAEETAAAARQRAAQAENAAAEARAGAEQAAERLKALRQQIEAQKAELESVKRATEAAKLAQSALDAFDGI